jgi:hypothetical protein
VGRNDVLRLTGDALDAARAVNDDRAVQRLSVAPAYRSAALGDLRPARALVAACVASGNDQTTFQIATGLGDALASLGQLEELDEINTLSADLAEAGGLDLKDCNVGPLQAIALHLAGDLTTPAERLPDGPVSWRLFSRSWAAMAARVAVCRDDLALLERAAKLVGRDDTPGSDGLVCIVDWAQAVLTGDLDAAIQAALAAVDGTKKVRFTAGRALTDLVATLTTARRWNDAAVALAELCSFIDAIDEPAPLWRARAGIVEARLALAGGDPSGADTARVALHTATSAGLRLEQVDALETIAVAADAALDHDTAARVLAAATAVRHHLGYNGRLTTPATQTLIDRLVSSHRTAWNEGSTQLLDQTISGVSRQVVNRRKAGAAAVRGGR